MSNRTHVFHGVVLAHADKGEGLVDGEELHVHALQLGVRHVGEEDEVYSVQRAEETYTRVERTKRNEEKRTHLTTASSCDV